VDLASRAVADKVLLPDGPPGARPLIPRTFSHGIGIAPVEESLRVTSLLDDPVSASSLPDRKRLGTTHVGNASDWMTFGADGSRCGVPDAGSDAVSVLDVASRRGLTRVPVGAMPKRIISVVGP
jgi:YVTN family beta-propeller protein